MNSGGEPIRTAPIYPNMTQRDALAGEQGASAETPVRIDKVNLYIARKLGRDRVRVECNCLILNCSCCGGKGFYFVDVPPKQEEVESQ